MIDNLDDLYDTVMKCEKCELCKTRANVVFGVGPTDAKIMFIGEGPGENEDKQGEPFVGRSGQLLDKLLMAVDLSRKKNVYIANIVKCRPPQNRDPSKEESEICIDYLRNQVALIKPKIIVCLGRVSAVKIIAPTYKVTQEHGKWLERGSAFITGTFHPAALLRNPNNKPIALEDFIAVKTKAMEICPEIFD